MTIHIAEAALASNFNSQVIIGFYPWSQGILDPESGSIKADGVSSWGALKNTTWDSFTSYIQTYLPIKWTSPKIDVGMLKYFNISIETDYDGELYFIIFVSETGDFHGEEIEYRIENGNYDIAAFYGRYVLVTTFVSGLELRRVTITTNSNSSILYLSNIDSSTLNGTPSAREIVLPTPVSQIIDMSISVKAAVPYAVNLYVSDTPTSEVVIPVVVSKTASLPTFALYGIDNDARDGTVDITLVTLPRQAMISGNLIVIE